MTKILNLEFSFETQSSKKKKKKFLFVQINQDFIDYMLKRKLAVFHCLFIFSLFNIQDERLNK